MVTNLLKDRVLLYQRVATQSALGQTVTWKPVKRYYARVIPLDVRTIASYQQLSTVVSHRVEFRGDVTITLGGYRIAHGSKTYEPVQSARHTGDTLTDVLVKEV